MAYDFTLKGRDMMSVFDAMRVAMMLAFVQAAVFADEYEEPVVLKGHVQAVTALAWSGDGKSLATASDDRSICVWDTVRNEQSAQVSKIAREGYGGPVVAFTADLGIMAINYWGEIRVRRVADNQVLVKIDPILDREQKSAFRPDVFAMAFSPDGKWLATAGSVAAVGGRHGLPGGIVLVWDAKSGELIQRLDKLSTSASSVTWSADGKWLVAGTSGAGGELQEAGEVRVWDAETWKPLKSVPVKAETKYGEWASAADVAVSPDGKWMAAPITAGSRGTPSGILIKDRGASVRVWDVETGQDVRSLSGLQEVIRRVVFSPDGKQLATAGSDKVVRVWSVETGKELTAMSSPTGITTVAYRPDGRFLAAGSEDGSVRIWGVDMSR